VPRERKPRPDQKRDAYSSGLGLLARREHSVRELKSKLARRGHVDGDIKTAVDKLSDKRYQSDDRFGELKSHGLAEVAIRAAIAATEADWPAIAAAQLQRRFGDLAPADTSERARRAQFLLRRGFDPATVRTVTRAVVDDPAEEFD